MEQSLSSEQLQVLPELAILAALDVVLQTTIRALHAVHPDLAEDEPYPKTPEPIPASQCAAEVIVHLARIMLDAIERYQRVNRHRIHVGSTPCGRDAPF